MKIQQLLGVTYTKGLLGIDQRATVDESLKQAALDRQIWTKRIEMESYQEIQSDPALMTIVRQTGHTLFGDNCAACHGHNAKGSVGFPDLTTSSSLWGGDPAAIAETIRIGINATHRDSRVAQMLAFGRDKIMPRSDVENVATYVQTLSNPAAAAQFETSKLEAGKNAFMTNCSACHGDNGKGNVELGAPDLTDNVWVYGGDPQSIFDSIWNGRQGHMPAWEGRLGPIERKILAVYLSDLRSRKP